MSLRLFQGTPMRISPSQTFAGIGAFAGLVLIIAIALVEPSHAAQAPGKACPPPAAKAHASGRHTHRTHAAGHAHRAGLMRAHAWRGHGGGHHGYVDRRGWRSEHQWGGGRQWAGESQWSDERDFGESHHWREGGGWVERPWATDQFGYLTWPGKTHFGGPPAPEGAAPPPAAAAAVGARRTGASGDGASAAAA